MQENENKLQILIVDDTPKNIQLLGTFLSQEGYQIAVAQNGVQALNSVRKSLPDLILLDIMMPELDGFETCQRLKASEATQHIPVIFLTAKVDTKDILRGFELGAVDYITKPLQLPEVLARVETQLKLRVAQKEVEKKNMQLEVLNNKLSKYLSPQVYETIFSGEKDVKIETTRKRLTIFFSDIVDFTLKAEGMKHRDLAQWLNRYLNQMAEIALRYEGTLDKFMGDAVMIFFGDPKTMGEEIDALQCVKMAMDMQACAKELGAHIRIGINNGECTVGNFGSDNRMDYTIIGRSVNLASRLEKHGEAGRIHISETIYNLVKGKVPCIPRGNIRVKGIDRDIMTYWIGE